VSKVNLCDIHLNNQLPPLTRDPYWETDSLLADREVSSLFM
jgi:hypothetical protein